VDHFLGHVKRVRDQHQDIEAEGETEELPEATISDEDFQWEMSEREEELFQETLGIIKNQWKACSWDRPV
jgi:hypothetical protein